MVRALVIASLLAACSGSKSRGPAWPKPSAKTVDGGESLAPHRYSPLSVNDVPSEDIIAIDPITEKPIVRPTPDVPTDTPARPTPPTVTSPDVIINIDDIVIDLDD